MADEKLPKEKWKPQFVSPGDAWMDHVERHHNAGAATPEYLKEKSQAVQQIEKAAQKYVSAFEKAAQDKGQPEVDNFQDKVNETNIHMGKVKAAKKEKDDKEKKEKNIDVCR